LPRLPDTARRLWAILAAVAVFVVTCLLSVFVTPYALGLLDRCVPPDASCGDVVGWAMLISAPVSIPLILLLSGALACLTYVRVARDPDKA
jgi:hypothetical protein